MNKFVNIINHFVPNGVETFCHYQHNIMYSSFAKKFTVVCESVGNLLLVSSHYPPQLSPKMRNSLPTREP